MRQPNTSKMIPMVVRDEFGKLELVFVETNTTDNRKPQKPPRHTTTTNPPRGKRGKTTLNFISMQKYCVELVYYGSRVGFLDY